MKMNDIRYRSGHHFDDIVSVLRSCVNKPENVYVWTAAALQAADDMEDMCAAGDRLCDILSNMQIDGYCILTDNELEAIEFWKEARRG